MFYNAKGVRGVFWFILSLLVSSAGDVIMKELGVDMHPYQVVFLRFFFASLTLLPWLYFNKNSFKTKRLPLHFIRGLFLFAGISFWCAGLNVVKISLATTINFTIPIFVAVLAVMFLKERFTLFRFIATVFGFIGVIVSMNVSSVDFNIVSLSLLISSFLFASLDVINKKFVTDETTISMLFYSNIFTSLLSFIPAILVWQPVSIKALLLLLVLGVVANLILYLILKAFELVDASGIAPYRYIELLFSSVFGYLFFKEVPDSNIIYGAVVIIIATLFVLYEGLLKRKVKL
jgi:S-adenosylmethionine uptake transporter